MIVRAALALGLTLSGGASQAASQGADRSDLSAASHCRSGERAVYSCRFGSKIGSVCLGSRSIHYRYGPRGRPEIAISSRPDWSNVHIGGNRSQAGLNQDHIRFSNGDVHYVIHSSETGPLNERPGRKFSGILALGGADGGKELANLQCPAGTRFASGLLGDLHRAAPKGWDGEEAQGGPFDVLY